MSFKNYSEPSLIFKWLFHILIFATGGKYQNKRKATQTSEKSRTTQKYALMFPFPLLFDTAVTPFMGGMDCLLYSAFPK